MDSSKKAAFVKAMGRQKFSKGGMIRKLGNRQYFAPGGTVNPAVNPNTGILGTLGGALGLNNNFQAGAANIQAGTNQGQLGTAYQGAQGALGQVGQLANTLAPQAQGAVNNQNTLANQYLAMTQGQGPNPAQAQLNQATGANVANQAALMAGQRGAGANAGLLARQAAQQGAATQQQAVGQGATLEAQQQIAAQQNLANLANQQVGQAGQGIGAANMAQQNEQNILQGANTAYNNAAVGMQSNINNADAQAALANQQLSGNLFGGVGQVVSGISNLFAQGGEVEKDHHIKLAEMNAQSLMHGRENFADGGWAGGYQAPVQMSGPNIEATPQLINPSNNENFANDIKKLQKPSAEPATTTGQAGDWELGGGLAGGPQDVMSNEAPMSPGAELAGDAGALAFVAHGGMLGQDHAKHFHEYFSDGGAVPAMLSPGEVYLSPEKVRSVVQDGANALKVGQKIPGKPKVKGDSLKNDTVPMTLEEGGVVIPRHVMKKMSPEKAELFVLRAIARKKAGR